MASEPHPDGHLDTLLNRLAREHAVLVTVLRTRGSVPREAGTWMAVFADTQVGSIGGGRLEWDALRQARAQLPGAGQPAWEQQVALGPSLGQCCGGSLVLGFQPLRAADAAALRQRLAPVLTPVALFGGGHVGHALVRALAPLPFHITWIDSRDEVFPADVPPQVQTEHADPVQSAVAGLAPGARVLIMSFSHAEDLDIVAACLQRLRQRADLAFVGLIGSRSKWASFRHRLAERGFSDAELARVTCPIGLPGIRGKEPAVIAASVVAQLLQTHPQAASPGHGPQQ
ncbi:MAG: xanthine dehydrogenase accessory protein XdhC [Comamonadaceae bacterium]|nr:xanthine dehydrogenase accessory protein XdhC [Comamonadaceae bacterium]